MLDPWIIEEIRRREEERRRDSDAQRIELPLYNPEGDDRSAEDESEEEIERGVVIIDL